jgi:signal transduction histidine kinase
MAERRFPSSHTDRSTVRSDEMAAARRCLDVALERFGELSAADRARIVYLEQSALDKREATEDTFHAANNALFAISVNVELLKNHLSDECEHAEVQRWLGLLLRKTEEIGAVMRRLLTPAGDAAEGPLYLVQSFVSLRSMIDRTVEIYGDIALAKNIEISWELPEFPAITIWTDGIAVGTVLDNLLSNAIKFSEPGETISVRMTRKGTELICCVCDHGPGLSKDDQSKVFQRGCRLDPKPTGGESSSGYGLAAARRVVESLGGRIWCESVEGEGACFKFSLPTGIRPLAADAQQPSAPLTM